LLNEEPSSYFEWDEIKNNINIAKHGIDFADVPAIFDLPMLVELDMIGEYDEERWKGIGMLSNGFIVVIYTEPDGNTTRIISARRANKHERSRYEHAFTD